VEMAKAYAENRSSQVFTEMMSILSFLNSLPNIDEKTAKIMWCAKMRPELTKTFERPGLNR
jgi:hypothetical protein